VRRCATAWETTPVPVQVTPLSVKVVGTGLVEVHDPLKPNEALAFVASEPFQPTSAALT